MKKIDIILALIIGEAVAWLFVDIFKGIEFLAEIELLNWILPIAFPIMAVIGLWVTFLIGKKFLFVFQAGKFSLAGAFFTVIDVGLLNVLIWISGIASGPFYSVFKGISFIIATLVKYFGSKFWVFEQFRGGVTGKQVGKFFLITIIGLGINVGVASFLVNIIGPQFEISEIAWASIGGIIAAFATATWNFIGYKFIVFKK